MAASSQRFDFRLTAANRKLIERAARVAGQPMTAFATQVLVTEAERVLALDTQRHLTERDWKKFLSILDSEKVAPALVRAAKKYRAR